MSKIDPTLVADADIIVAPDTHARKEEGAKSPDTLILLITLFGVILRGCRGRRAGDQDQHRPDHRHGGLYIPALAAVPVIWTMLILITRG